MRKILCDACNREINGESGVRCLSIDPVNSPDAEKWELCTTCTYAVKRFLRDLNVRNGEAVEV